MSVYKVVTNLKHDGAFFKAGEKIELEESIATPLLDDGVLDLIDEEAEAAAHAKPLTPAEKKAKQEAEKAAETPAVVESEEAEEVAYSDMTKKELLAVAKAEGVEVPEKATKDEIVELIQRAKEEQNL
jgi:hypothetical protein